MLDCYKSGLSIPSWCKEKGIAPGTFYGWIKQVANKGYDVPDFTRHGTAYKQEIVKVSVVDSLNVVPCADVFPAIENKEVPATAFIIGTFKEFPLGTIKPHDNAEYETTMAVTYAKLVVNGLEIFEIDVLENIYKVSVLDMLKTFKKNIGG